MADRRYTKTHEWVAVDGKTATVGITDFAQAQLGDVVFLELPSIGRKVAEKIVEYREHHGRFQKPEELRKVEGIGSGLWERNRARIVIK